MIHQNCAVSVGGDGELLWRCGFSFLNFLFQTLCHSASLPTSRCLAREQQCMVSASNFAGRVWNPTLAPGVTFHMAQMPTTIFVPHSHKTEVEQEVTHTHTHTQPPHHPCGACITLELVGGRWMGDHLKAYDQSTPCLHVWSVLGPTVRWALLWPSINLHDLPQAVCSVSHSHSEDSVSAQPCFRFLLSTQGQTGEAVSFRKGIDAVTKWLSKSERAEVKRCK